MEKKPQASQPTDAEEDEIEAPRQRLSLQPTSGKGGRALAILGVVLRGLGSTLGLLFRGLSRLVISSVHGIRSLTKGRRVTSVAKNFPHAANRNMARSSQWWTRLSTSRRRVLLVAIVLILLFAQSVLSIGDGRERKKQQEEYASLVLQAKESVAAADAALLIDNESGAREQLTKAMELLGRIPDTKNAPREEVAQTKVIINEKLGTIRHAIAVTPESVADLAGLEVGFSATVLGARADDLFTVSSRSSSIFRITPADKSTATVVDAPSLEYGIISFVPGGTSLLALAADGGMQSINPADGSLSSLAVQYQNVDRNVIAATIYNSRLYTLDSLNNQIFRHERSGAGYGLGNAWVSEVGADVRDAQSMAIDGTVFVLMKNGSLLNFSGGKKSATTFDAADPVLSEPTMLFTDADTPTLFVLDAKEHRIVEFEKDGTFLRQYVADAFASAANIVVVDGTIYILAGTQILSTPVVTEE